MQNLPIDRFLPDISKALENSPSLVVKAPPGSGKTTRIPISLLKSSFLKNKKIVMLEPRRLAAVNASRWMAASLGEEVGDTVGYAIRFDRKVSAGTRLEVVTEGVLTRRLQADPFLEDVGIVIFDEFHERSLHADLALALCREVQKGVRNDLRLVVMSATLECGPIAELLGNVPVIAVEGQSFPVDIRYLDRDPGGDLVTEVAGAVRIALAETEGDILVFLPGSGEIRRCHRLLEGVAGTSSLEISPLYGDLPFAAQERAILPGKRRKVVLATNIAETSLTIEGVRVVVDSGFSRQLRFDTATGLDRLATLRISAASATQRSGRAGRLGPGVCYRLWSRHTQSTLIPFTPPEILTSDMASLALEIAEWGIQDPAGLDWIDPPPAPSLAEGRRLLQCLGAMDANGVITPHGKRMAFLPVHPRLAHMMLVAHDRGEGRLAADLAALLSERDILRFDDNLVQRPVSSSDLLDRVEALSSWRKGGKVEEWGRLDPWLLKVIDRTSGELLRRSGGAGKGNKPGYGNIGVYLAMAFPERIGRQREPGSDRYLLANGRGGRLSPRSAVRDQPFIVAVAMDAGERGDGLIHLASSISLEELRREFGDRFRHCRKVQWDRREGRVTAMEEECLGELVVASRNIIPHGDELIGAMLEGVRVAGLSALNWTPQASQLRARVAHVTHLFPKESWPDLSDNALILDLERWLAPHLEGVRSLSDLMRVDMLAALKGILTWEEQRRLDEGMPTHITVPSGSRVAVNYSADGPPVLAVKLQELFGLAETPTVAWGREAVLLHLLSPAGRPIQVTGDLRNFWDKVYPEVKKELKGRYPKHPWPEDPWSAVPTRHVKKRMKSES